jgi:hypothetical protein
MRDMQALRDRLFVYSAFVYCRALRNRRASVTPERVELETDTIVTVTETVGRVSIPLPIRARDSRGTVLAGKCAHTLAGVPAQRERRNRPGRAGERRTSSRGLEVLAHSPRSVGD